MRPWILSEINYGYLREHPCEVAVLPMGATEPHNLHLPYGTDIFEAEAIAGRACEAAFKHGAARRACCRPSPTAPTRTSSAFPLAINLNPSTLTQVIRDIVDSLAVHGIVKLLHSEQPRRQRFQTRAPRALRQDARAALPLRLVPHGGRRREADLLDEATITPAKWKRRWPWPIFPTSSPAIRKTGRLAADDGAVKPTRFDAVNQRLGLDHAAVAPVDDELGIRQSAPGHGRKGAAP